MKDEIAITWHIEDVRICLEDRLSLMTEENQKNFREHSALLIKFLDDCIEDEDSIRASL